MKTWRNETIPDGCFVEPTTWAAWDNDREGPRKISHAVVLNREAPYVRGVKLIPGWSEALEKWVLCSGDSKMDATVNAMDLPQFDTMAEAVVWLKFNEDPKP